MANSGRILVYGGKGALGSACVQLFKKNNWWVGSIDLKENSEADANIVVENTDSWQNQHDAVINQISQALGNEKVEAVICVAGGWAGGNAASADFVKNSDLMWRQSVWSSTISASIAAKFLKEGGFVSLPGAHPALEGTPGMIGYGMAKAAVHQLTKSLAAKNSGLPANSLVVSILPVTLDTPMNRKWMPDADTSTWTPLEFIAGTFLRWTKGEDRPHSGSLLSLITVGGETKLVKNSAL